MAGRPGTAPGIRQLAASWASRPPAAGALSSSPLLARGGDIHAPLSVDCSRNPGRVSIALYPQAASKGLQTHSRRSNVVPMFRRTCARTAPPSLVNRRRCGSMTRNAKPLHLSNLRVEQPVLHELMTRPESTLLCANQQRSESARCPECNDARGDPDGHAGRDDPIDRPPARDCRLPAARPARVRPALCSTNTGTAGPAIA